MDSRNVGMLERVAEAPGERSDRLDGADAYPEVVRLVSLLPSATEIAPVTPREEGGSAGRPGETSVRSKEGLEIPSP